MKYIVSVRIVEHNVDGELDLKIDVIRTVCITNAGSERLLWKYKLCHQTGIQGGLH